MAAPNQPGRQGTYTQNPETGQYYVFLGGRRGWVDAGLREPKSRGRSVPWNTVNRSVSIKEGSSILGENASLKKRSIGEILRYPYEALSDSTDYLQIDIREYDSVRTLSGGLTSNGPQRRISQQTSGINPTLGRLPVDASPDRFETGRIRGLSKSKLVSGQGTIILPIPSNVQDGNSVSFSEGNLDGVTAETFGVVKNLTDISLFSGGKNAIPDAIKTFTDEVGLGVGKIISTPAFKKAIMASLQAQAANIPLGGSLTRDAVFARNNGEILNQNVELLFNGVTIRSFKFSFKLTPRGPKEAQQVGLIINAFKRNMAAKVGGDANFLGTPNVFELTYKRGSNSHPFLHAFKQCVLTDMSVNYTGEGTYAVYDDSTPVSMVLELGFKELEPIYNLDYDDTQLTGVGY
jgi:hypothetical protein